MLLFLPSHSPSEDAGGCPAQPSRPVAPQDPLVSIGSSPLDRNFTELEIRRANILIELMTILEENRHIVLIAEHDPIIYKMPGT